jgi:uncharacterized SAM-dependent methyltransferase
VDATVMLQALRDVLESGDALLLGADLKKDQAVLERAYDDATGVTAAFNRNILGRINRELGGHFDLDSFAHRSFYNQAVSRIEMHLVSKGVQDIAIDDVGIVAHFEDGESIHTESSYKFDDESIRRLASATGFDVAEMWTDAEKRFADFLFVAR